MISYWTQVYNILKEYYNKYPQPATRTDQICFDLDKKYEDYSLSPDEFPEWFKIKILIQGIYVPSRSGLDYVKVIRDTLTGIRDTGSYGKVEFKKSVIESIDREEFIRLCFIKLYEDLIKTEKIKNWVIKSKRSKRYIDSWGLISPVNEYNSSPRETIFIYNRFMESCSFRLTPWSSFLMIYTPRSDIKTYCKIRNCIRNADLYEQLSLCC